MPGLTRYVCLTALLLIGAYASAETASLLLVDGKPTGAALVNFQFDQSQGLQAEFKSTEGMLTVSPNRFVRWGNPNKPDKRESVKLSDGSQILVSENWTSDDRLTLEDGTVSLYRTSGKVKFDLDSVRQVIFSYQNNLQNGDQESLLESSEVIYLNNKDQITGEITKFDSKELAIQVLDETITIAISEISYIDFNSSNPIGIDNSKACLVGLSDGSVLYAVEARGIKEHYQIRLACGVTIQCHLDEIVYLQPLGGAATYLSDLKAVDYRHTPYLSLEWPYGNDQMPFGGLLVFDKKIYLKGISLHSGARIVFPVRVSDKRFQTTVTVSDKARKIKNTSQRTADVQIVAIVADKLVPLVKKSIDVATPEPFLVDEDVSQARAIVIVVDYGLGADVGDDILLLDARFVGELP